MGAALKPLREFLANRGLNINNKSLTSLLVLLATLISLPVGIYLIKQNLTFIPRAAGELIQLGEGGCIKQNKDKKKVVDCPLVPLKLINPFFNLSTVTSSPSSQSSPAPSSTSGLMNGLVSYWKMDETSGDVVEDAMHQSANSNGIASNAPVADGKINKGRSIGATNSRIKIGNYGELGSTLVSVAGWIRPNSFGGDTFGSLFSRTPTGAEIPTFDIGYAVPIAGGTGFDGRMTCGASPIKENIDHPITATSAGADKLILNQWNHIVCTYDGSTLKLYINGKMVASTAQVGTLNKQAVGFDILIGVVHEAGSGLNAVVDEIGYWNRALTDAEVSVLAGGASPFQSGSPAPSGSAGTGTPQNVNVKNFNNNIQQALDSIKTSGGSVYLPTGTYLITEKVRLYSNITLFGDGMGASVIKFADNVEVDDMMANDTSSGQSNIVVRDLTLQGPDIPRIVDVGHGLKLENLDKAYIINVEVNDVMMDGIYLGYKTKNGAPKGVTNLRISGCKVNRSQRQQIGLIMGSNVVIDGCTIDGTNKHGQQVYVGIDLEPDDATTPVSNSVITGNTISNTNIGIALNGANGESKNAATVHDNKVCGNNVNAISVPIADSGQNNQISGSTCEIPASLATLPPVPTKPNAKRDSLWANLIKTVSAQDSDDVFIDGEDSDSGDQFVNDGTNDSDDNFGTGNPGSDKLLYRLAESQAGLNQAQWKEFALLPTQTNLAVGNNHPFSLSGWITKIAGDLMHSVSAQEPTNCAKHGPEDPSLTQSPISDEVGKLGAKKCNEEKENIGGGVNKEITIQSGNQNSKFNSSTIVNRQQSVYENGFVIHFWWSDGHESWDFKDKIGVLKKNTGFIKRNNIQKKTADQQFNNGYVITLFADKTIEYNKFQGVGENIKFIPAESFALYNPDYKGDTPTNAPAIAAQVFGKGNPQVVQSQTANIGNNNNNGGNNGGGGGAGGGAGAGGGGAGAGGAGSGSSGTGAGGSGTNGTGSTGSSGTASGPLPQSSGTPSFSIGSQFINTTFQLSDTKPGTKQIWVQFLHPDGTTRVDSVTFNLVDKTPQILGLACNLDISKENLKITIEGEHFGNSVGTIETTSPSKLKPEVLGWNDKQAIGFLKKPNIPINEGSRFKIKVIRPDGFESGEAVCAVDKSLVSLGARIFCREPGKFDAKDVAVNLIYNPEDPSNPNKLNKIEEKVTISADGEIANLKTKLQVGKNYAIAIKAPSSLRRTAVFTAQEGTTEIVRPDGSPFILPVGDIAPPVSPDGRINTLDRSELIRQWRILGQSNQSDSRLTGDFNRDSRVNSIDWACMNYDFGQEDESIPVSVPQAASGSIRIGGGQATLMIPTSNTSSSSSTSSSPPSPSPNGSASPVPSPSKDTSNSVKIDLGGKLFLDTNRNQIADIGESYISQGAAVVKLLQVPEEHVVGTTLTAEELADSKILTQVTNNLPGANYDISVFVDKDSGSKFSVLATANSGQLTGIVDFALQTPLVDSSQVINIPLTSATQ